MENIKTYKFGGAVLSTLAGFRNMLKIIRESSDSKIILVVSAFSKSTRTLKEAGIIAAEGDNRKAEKIIDNLAEEYLFFAKNLISDISMANKIEKDINNTKTEILNLIRGISIVSEITPRTLDLLMSFGEKLSLNIAYNYLKINGVSIDKADSSRIIKTNSKFGNAVPNLKASGENIQRYVSPLFEEYNVIITQGFVASDFDNEITTMGLESSNLTAAIYSKFLNCDEIVLFTDVDGLRSSDPKENESTKLLNTLSYSQAYLLGINGLKLIFPRMVRLAEKSNIIIKIKSGLSNSEEETVISKLRNEENIAVKISGGLKYVLKINLNQNSDYFVHCDKSIRFPKFLLKKLRKRTDINFNTNITKFKITALQSGYAVLEFEEKVNIRGIKECEKITFVHINSDNYDYDYEKYSAILIVSDGSTCSIYNLNKL